MNEQQRKWGGMAIRFLTPIIALMALIPAILGIAHKSQKPPKLPHIKAASYVWANGCRPKIYKNGDDISLSCRVSNYSFDDQVMYYDLPSLGKGHHGYYRIGNDLDGIECNMIFDNNCKVQEVVSNSYYQ